MHAPSEYDDEALVEFYDSAEEMLGPANRSRWRSLLTQGSADAKQFMDTFGADFPQAAAQLVEAITAEVASSCGIPPVLLSRTVAGAGYRDAWRSFVTTSVQSACDVIAAAVVDQLGVDCEIEARARPQHARRPREPGPGRQESHRGRRRRRPGARHRRPRLVSRRQRRRRRQRDRSGAARAAAARRTRTSPPAGIDADT